MNAKHSLLTTFCNYSKISTFGSLIVLIPFLIWAIWDDKVKYSEPSVKSFHDVKLIVSGAAKSPPTIIIYEGANKVFFADCTPQMASLCHDRKYWGKVHSVNNMLAIETRSKFGIIKSISIDAGDGLIVEINDPDADILHIESARTSWRAVYILSFVFLISLILLTVCRQLMCKTPQKEHR